MKRPSERELCAVLDGCLMALACVSPTDKQVLQAVGVWATLVFQTFETTANDPRALRAMMQSWDCSERCFYHVLDLFERKEAAYDLECAKLAAQVRRLTPQMLWLTTPNKEVVRKALEDRKG
jgi:hypothetical protein